MQEKICKVCENSFIKASKKREKPNKNIRGCNAINCSKECSRLYFSRRFSYVKKNGEEKEEKICQENVA